MEIIIGVLTVSDRVSQGKAEDLSGPKIIEITNQKKDILKATNIKHITKVVPDEIELIKNALLEWVDNEKCHLILTTGKNNQKSDLNLVKVELVLLQET